MNKKQILISLLALMCIVPQVNAACCGKNCGKQTRVIRVGGCCKKTTWTVWTKKAKKKRNTNPAERPKKVAVDKKSIRTFYNERLSDLKNVRRLGN